MSSSTWSSLGLSLWCPPRAPLPVLARGAFASRVVQRSRLLRPPRPAPPGPDMPTPHRVQGVRGAALATVLSHTAGAAYLYACVAAAVRRVEAAQYHGGAVAPGAKMVRVHLDCHGRHQSPTRSAPPHPAPPRPAPPRPTAPPRAQAPDAAAAQGGGGGGGGGRGGVGGDAARGTCGARRRRRRRRRGGARGGAVCGAEPRGAAQVLGVCRATLPRLLWVSFGPAPRPACPARCPARPAPSLPPSPKGSSPLPALSAGAVRRRRGFCWNIATPAAGACGVVALAAHQVARPAPPLG
jgi:hypothetical protein